MMEADRLQYFSLGPTAGSPYFGNYWAFKNLHVTNNNYKNVEALIIYSCIFVIIIKMNK